MSDRLDEIVKLIIEEAKEDKVALPFNSKLHTVQMSIMLRIMALMAANRGVEKNEDIKEEGITSWW